MFERIKNWEKYPPCIILYDLKRWYEIDSIMTIEDGRCESGVWITIKLTVKGQDFIIQGSRLDVARNRLIEFIDKQKIRDAVLSSDC